MTRKTKVFFIFAMGLFITTAIMLAVSVLAHRTMANEIIGFALLPTIIGYTGFSLIRFSSIKWLGWFIVVAYLVSLVGMVMNAGTVTVEVIFNIVVLGIGGGLGAVTNKVKEKLCAKAADKA